VILVLPNWLLGLEDFEQVPAFDLATGQVCEKRTSASGPDYFVDLHHKILR
jgi:hypothetical protein